MVILICKNIFFKRTENQFNRLTFLHTTVIDPEYLLKILAKLLCKWYKPSGGEWVADSSRHLAIYCQSFDTAVFPDVIDTFRPKMSFQRAEVLWKVKLKSITIYPCNEALYVHRLLFETLIVFCFKSIKQSFLSVVVFRVFQAFSESGYCKTASRK